VQLAGKPQRKGNIAPGSSREDGSLSPLADTPTGSRASEATVGAATEFIGSFSTWPICMGSLLFRSGNHALLVDSPA
jgi:hypothetical protein